MTPVTLYNGLKPHAPGRQERSIQTSHTMGLPVSHARVIEVRGYFAKVVTRMWNEIGVVIPPTVKLKVFVTGSTDNLDISGRDRNTHSYNYICT